MEEGGPGESLPGGWGEGGAATPPPAEGEAGRAPGRPLAPDRPPALGSAEGDGSSPRLRPPARLTAGTATGPPRPPHPPTGEMPAET